MQRAPRELVFFVVACWIVGVSAGCQSAEERHVRRMMWYRPPPAKRVVPMSASVGHAGHSARFGVGAGFTVSDAGTARGSQVGRALFDRTAVIASGSATRVVGEPVGHTASISRSGQASYKLGVVGTTMSSSPGTEHGADIGTGP